MSCGRALWVLARAFAVFADSTRSLDYASQCGQCLEVDEGGISLTLPNWYVCVP